MRVLVVEDEIRLAENIAIAFREGPGYAVDVCQGGDEALLLCETTTYDLVLLDLMIPKLPGQEVLCRLRDRNEGAPVLILTAVTWGAKRDRTPESRGGRLHDQAL